MAKNQFNTFAESPIDYIVWDMDGTLTKPGASRFVTPELEPKLVKMLECADLAFQSARKVKNLVYPDFHIERDTKKKILSIIAKQRSDALFVLDALSQKGIKHSIISNNSRKAVGDKVLDFLRLDNHFRSTYFLEDMDGLKKPNPAVLKKLIKDQDIAPDATIWVVGDSKGDILLALAADKLVPQTIVPVAMGEESAANKFLCEKVDSNINAVVLEEMHDILNLMFSSDEIIDFEPSGFEDEAWHL